MNSVGLYFPQKPVHVDSHLYVDEWKQIIYQYEENGVFYEKDCFERKK